MVGRSLCRSAGPVVPGRDWQRLASSRSAFPLANCPYLPPAASFASIPIPAAALPIQLLPPPPPPLATEHPPPIDPLLHPLRLPSRSSLSSPPCV